METPITSREYVEAAPPDEPTLHHRSARERRAGRGGSGGGGVVGELNLTSMIDVIFQLLIYFVVTAGFMIDEGVLAAKLPQGAAGAVSADELPPDKIEIRLTADDTDDSRVQISRGPRDRAIRYEGFRELAEDLGRLRYDPQRGEGGLYDADNPVLIQPSGSVRWQHVVNAFNAALAAGYTNVSFAEAE